MLPRDLTVLIGHYSGLFGAVGWLLTADRALRSALPTGLYRPLAHVTWLRGGRGRLSFRADAVPPDDTRGESDADRADWYSSEFPGALEQKVSAGDRILEHSFDFLGTDSRHWGDPIDWHLDVKSGYRWPRRFYLELLPVFNTTDATDGKIPYELSRLHHLVTLGQAWWLSRDERYATEFFSQWESWTESNPWPYGVNWTSAMEAGIRAANLTWAAGLLQGAPGWTPKRRAVLEKNLWQHGRFIEHNLEVGVADGDIVAANHYLADLCGLACLGLSCGEGPDAERWTRAGLKGLEQEMRRQVLPDGFFFESSTSYHRLAVELFMVPALLARRAGREMSDDFWRRLERMLEVVLYTTGPDGWVPQIGDGDDGRALILSGYPDWPRHDHRYLLALGAVLFQRGDFKSAALPSSNNGNVPGAYEEKSPTGGCPEEVFWLLGREGVEQFHALPTDHSPIGSRGFPQGGLYVMRSEDNRDYALARTASRRGLAVGEPGQKPGGGPDCVASELLSSPSAGIIPTGHAHNDALSIELWVEGQQVFVDPGTPCYTSDLESRDLFRSTAAHNTAEVDGSEINRIPPHEPFRLERDARVTVHEWRVGPDEIRLVAAHDGYGRLKSPVRHQRSVTYDISARSWNVADELEGDGAHAAVFRWHSPQNSEMHVASVDMRQVRVTSTVAQMLVQFDPAAADWSHGVEAATYAPAYGVSRPGSCFWVSVRFEGRCSLSWSVSSRGSFTDIAHSLVKGTSHRQ